MPSMTKPTSQVAPISRRIARACSNKVRESVYEILTRSEYRDNARRIQSEIAALPAFAQGLRLLEWLARTTAPLHA
jgi:UDP:flavonoid glycosyltransferase YjiC (YdhE family)